MSRQLINLGLVAEVVKAVLTVVTKNSELITENASLKSQLAEAIAAEQDLGDKLDAAELEAEAATEKAEAATANAVGLTNSLQQFQSESAVEDTDEAAANGVAEAQLSRVLEALLALDAAPAEVTFVTSEPVVSESATEEDPQAAPF